MNTSFFTTAATVKRLTQTVDKSAYAVVAGTIYGFFQPIDPDQRPKAAEIVSQGYQFICSGENDIRAADLLTVASKVYTVRGIRRYTLESIDILDCLLELSVKV
jgi:hypothetical protein